MSTLANFPVAEYRARYGLGAFVETGTYLGASVVAAVRAGFQRVVSCELEPSFVERAILSLDAADQKWREGGRAVLYVGRSVDVLPEMLRLVLGIPTLIFLDSHIDPSLFDGALARRPAEPALPLVGELTILRSQRDVARDVIIIDDLHLYTEARWVGDELAALWGVPPPPFQSPEAIAALFPEHHAAVANSPDPALILTPRGGT